MINLRYSLPSLPYEYSALKPVISEEIMRLHHDKHHQAYVDGANSALKLIEEAREGADINVKAVMRDLSFNLNGHILHEIFWENMREYKENNDIVDELEYIIDTNFGSIETFKKEFSEAGKAVEGSGWVTLLRGPKGELLIMQIQNHNLLGINGYKPVLVNDVWEHAYYLDYKNDRAAYLETWWDVVNWDNVLERIKSV
jgi:superoxide dismutase, Fe-Mn family